MNQSFFFVKQLPFFGFFFLGTFALLLLIFFYRARTSIIIYCLSFAMLALALGEFWLWAGVTYDRTKSYFEGSYTTNHMMTDNELGYALTPGPRQAQSIKRSRSGELIYSVTYGINAMGLREGARDGAEPPAFFFGDSFTFGEGVNDSDTLPAQFASASGHSAFNFGVHGYGPHQFLRMLEIGLPERIGIRKEHAFVVFSFLTTHVDRAAGRAMWDPDGPFYKLTSNGIELSGPFPHTLLDRISNKSYIYRLIQPIFSEAKDRSRVLSILERANKIVKDRYGTNMLVVIWDGGEHLARAPWIADALTKAGIANLTFSEVVPPRPSSEYFIAGDGHPTPAAYAALAEAILKRCNGCFEGD